MELQDPVNVVQAWLEAVNSRDTRRALDLSDAEIELVGPRGSAYGHAVLKDWLARAGLSLETRRRFVRGNDVVLEQHGIWRKVDTGEITGEADVASHYKVRTGHVLYVARYDDLQTALDMAGLREADEVG